MNKLQIPDGYVVDQDNSNLTTGEIFIKPICPNDKLKSKGLHRVYGYEIKYVNGYIEIPLPNANQDWSVQAFESAIKICEVLTNAYIEHLPNGKYNRIYIRVLAV